MDWKTLLVVLAIIVALWLMKRLSLVSATAARQHLRQGALVVDVRTSAEFAAEHLPAALNIPLDALEELLPRQVPDKNQVLLLHCLSGGRSALAQRRLKALGYTRVWNLGSLSRARRIVTGQAPPG